MNRKSWLALGLLFTATWGCNEEPAPPTLDAGSDTATMPDADPTPQGMCLSWSEWTEHASNNAYCDVLCGSELLFCVTDTCYCRVGATGRQACTGTYPGTGFAPCEAAIRDGCCPIR